VNKRPSGDARAAWSEFCDRMRTLGDDIVGEQFPHEPGERARGFRYLASLFGFALEWYVDRSDPEFPAFVVCENEVVRQGAPNTDNLYLRSRVVPEGVYRITGNVAGVRELIVSVHQGEMQLGRMAVFEERNLAQLEVGVDGALELFLGGEARPGNWMALNPDAEYVLLRQYTSDWDRETVAHFDIERIGFEGTVPTPASEARVAAGLADAGEWIDATVRFWNEYSANLRAQLPPNVLSPPAQPPGSARDIANGMGCYELSDDEALVIECDLPKARYWSFQLLAHGWFECHDLNGMCSLNGDQTCIDADGRFRLVVAHADPGTPNWLCTEGRRSGLVNYRYVLASTFPTPEATVVPLTDLASVLPASAAGFGPDERRAQLAARQRAIARRYR